MSPPQSSPSRPAALRLIVLGVVLNIALAAIKLVAGLFGHSHALVADAIESMGDIFSSAVVSGAVWISARPADSTHPYGHGRVEPLATLFVALTLGAAALGIAVESVHEVLRPHTAPAAYTLWVLLLVVAVKETMYRVLLRAGGSNGGAVGAEAWHHRSDAITSAAAGVGIAIGLIGGDAYAAADDWAALVAAGVILFNAWRLLRPAIDEILDRHPAELVERVRVVAGRVEGVRAIEKVLGRKVGAGYWVDMHMEVDPQTTVWIAHELAHRVKDEIRRALPEVTEVLIHIEPFRGG